MNIEQACQLMKEHSDPALAMYQVKEQPKKMISMLKSEFPSELN